MQKAADAFRTISEVADDLSLPQHVLRFWETRFPQIRPLKRAGGRRYYRPADVTLLRTIRQLLYDDGYTIKGVQRLLKEQGPRGLGGGTRSADADTGPMAEVDGVETADIGDASTPLDTSELLAELHAANEGAELSGRDYRSAIEDALSTVEECQQILETVLRKR